MICYLVSNRKGMASNVLWGIPFYVMMDFERFEFVSIFISMYTYTETHTLLIF